jgi:hypothetical protein
MQTILTGDFLGSPQPLHTNSGSAIKLHHNRFISLLFRFTFSRYNDIHGVKESVPGFMGA